MSADAGYEDPSRIGEGAALQALRVPRKDVSLAILLRHGETEGQSSIRFHGSTDVALSQTGRDQVGATAREVDLSRLDHVLSSPMRRALESVEVLVPGRAPRIVRGFREIDFGECEGLTAEEIQERFPTFHRRWKAGMAVGFPGGEPFESFRERVCEAAEEAAERGWFGGRSLLVAHKGVLKVLLAHWSGIDFAERHRFDAPLGGGFLVRGEGTLPSEGS